MRPYRKGERVVPAVKARDHPCFLGNSAVNTLDGSRVRITRGGPGKRCRSPPYHVAADTRAAPPTTQTDRSLGGCIPMTIKPAQPMTLNTANGRYQRSRFHGPISVQVRPCAQAPRAVGKTYECKERSCIPQ